MDLTGSWCQTDIGSHNTLELFTHQIQVADILVGQSYRLIDGRTYRLQYV